MLRAGQWRLPRDNLRRYSQVGRVRLARHVQSALPARNIQVPNKERVHEKGGESNRIAGTAAS